MTEYFEGKDWAAKKWVFADEVIIVPDQFSLEAGKMNQEGGPIRKTARNHTFCRNGGTSSRKATRSRSKNLITESLTVLRVSRERHVLDRSLAPSLVAGAARLSERGNGLRNTVHSLPPDSR